MLLQVISGYVRLGQVKIGKARMARLMQIRTGYATLGHVRPC
jgi:hypothetical protein